MKFSSVIAPGLGIQMSSWGLTLAYLYFMLCRATFVHGYRAPRTGLVERQADTAAERAFGAALAGRRHRSLVAGATMLVVCAVADLALRGLEVRANESIESAIVMASIAVWLVIAPGLLLSWAFWAADESLLLTRGFGLIGRYPGRVIVPWLALVLGLAVISFAALQILYSPLRAVVAQTIPNGKVVFLFSVLFFAGLIAMQVWGQAVFATWMRRDIEQVLAPSAKPPGHGAPQTIAEQRFARFGIESGRTVVRNESPMKAATVAWGMRCLGVMIVLFSSWMAIVILSSVTLDARITGSRAVCSVAWASALHVGNHRDHNDAMACSDVAAFIAADSDRRAAAVTESLELTLAYLVPSGPETTFKQVLPKAMGLPLVRAGHAAIDYRPAVIPHAVIPKGSRFQLLWANLFLGSTGLLLALTPNLIRWRFAKRARARGEPAPTPPAPLSRFKIAKIIALFVAGGAFALAFPALVPLLKLVAFAAVVILGLMRGWRAL